MKKLHSPTLQSLSDLLFPRSCLGCNRYLNFYESTLCITCQIELPQTHFQNTRKNPVFNKLDLLFPIEAATAAFIFQKEGLVAHLIYDFKYKGNHQSGLLLTHYLTIAFKESLLFREIEGIVPVPLHHTRKRKRGFNQAEIIGKVIAQKLKIPFYADGLIRLKKTKALAHIGDEDRWNEIKDAFVINSSYKRLPNHLLLVDDVITTGATLSACADALKKNSSLKLSIAALACRL